MVRPALPVVTRSDYPAGTSTQDLEHLGDQIAELAAHLDAGTYRLLVLIREFDAREGWRSGFRTCAHWLNWRTGIEVGAEVPCEETTPGQRRADAIGFLAERALQGGSVEVGGGRAHGECGDGECGDGERGGGRTAATVSRADRFQVVLHVDAKALAHSETHDVGAEDGSGAGSVVGAVDGSVALQSELEDGVRVSAETSRRLACDASRVVMTHRPDGTVLDVGRRTRTVPPAIRRALDHRDKGCRFPGCGLRFCDAHHIEHWADGGETRLDGLVLLCRMHHRAVHEEGFGVTLTDDGRVHFRWPDGRPFPDAPQAPQLTEEPVRALEREHERMELAIDPWTPTSLWQGESLDLGLAIQMFRNA